MIARPQAGPVAGEASLSQAIRLRRPPSLAEAAAEPGTASSLAQSDLLDQAYDEFCRQREAGLRIECNAFCARFPSIQHSLARLIECHQFIEQNSHLVGAQIPTDWPSLGTDFAGFTLLRELGQGAFARVYQAREPALGQRLVAIKVSTQGAKEAAILGRLNHPNVVPVFSIREDQATGLSVVCMPYLGSRTLGHVLDHVHGSGRKPTSASVLLEACAEPDEAAPAAATTLLNGSHFVDGVRWLAAQMADALAFLHQQGICHRDLKPSNVLLRPSGAPVLLDFNLSSDVLLPETIVGGTPIYMAPEQLLAGVHVHPDPRSDIFSLGVMLFELLTGVHPFGPLPLSMPAAQLREHLRQRQQQGPSSLRQLNPDVDSRLARLVEQCLANDPAKRPQTAAALARCFRTGLMPWNRLGRWLARRPKLLAAAVLLSVGLGVAGAAHVASLPPEHVRRMEQGTQAYQNGQYHEAIAHFDAVLEAKEDAAVLFAKGRAYLKLGAADKDNYLLAAELFAKADELAPDGRNLACQGFCYQSLGRTFAAQAFDCYQQALAKGFLNAELQNNLASYHIDKAQLDDAESFLTKALQAAPDHSTMCFHRARSKLKAAALLSQKIDRPNLDANERKQIEAKVLALCEAGIESIRTSMKNFAKTDQLELAAQLHAVAARVDNRWTAPALDFLSRAMEQGADPIAVGRNELYSQLRTSAADQFQALCQRPLVRVPPSQITRLLDPVRD